MDAHPGVIFRDGPSGRRAALPYGPDVWEIVKFRHEIDQQGPEAVAAATEMVNLPAGRIWAAIHYYGAYAAEIDAEIDQAERESRDAETAWETEQGLQA